MLHQQPAHKTLVSTQEKINHLFQAIEKFTSTLAKNAHASRPSVYPALRPLNQIQKLLRDNSNNPVLDSDYKLATLDKALSLYQGLIKVYHFNPLLHANYLLCLEDKSHLSNENDHNKLNEKLKNLYNALIKKFPKFGLLKVNHLNFCSNNAFFTPNEIIKLGESYLNSTNKLAPTEQSRIETIIAIEYSKNTSKANIAKRLEHAVNAIQHDPKYAAPHSVIGHLKYEQADQSSEAGKFNKADSLRNEAKNQFNLAAKKNPERFARLHPNRNKNELHQQGFFVTSPSIPPKTNKKLSLVELDEKNWPLLNSEQSGIQDNKQVTSITEVSILSIKPHKTNPPTQADTNKPSVTFKV